MKNICRAHQQKRQILSEQLISRRDLPNLQYFLVYPVPSGRKVWVLHTSTAFSLYNPNWKLLLGELISNIKQLTGVYIGYVDGRLDKLVLTDAILLKGHTLAAFEYADRLDSLRWLFSNSPDFSAVHGHYPLPNIKSWFKPHSHYIFCHTDLRIYVQNLMYPSQVNILKTDTPLIFKHRGNISFKNLPKKYVPQNMIHVVLRVRKNNNKRKRVVLRPPLLYFAGPVQRGGFDLLTTEGLVLFNTSRSNLRVGCPSSWRWGGKTWVPSDTVPSKEEELFSTKKIINYLWYIHSDFNQATLKQATQ